MVDIIKIGLIFYNNGVIKFKLVVKNRQILASNKINGEVFQGAKSNKQLLHLKSCDVIGNDYVT